MKTKIELIVVVTVDHPKTWSKGQITCLAKETIGKSRIGGGGVDGMYRAEMKSARAKTK